MEIMTRCFSPSARLFTRPNAALRASRLALAAAAGLLIAQSADAYSLNGQSWPAGSEIVMQMGLGNSLVPLSDGNTNWNVAAAPALEMWNSRSERMRLVPNMNATSAATSGDRVNSAIFSTTFNGTSFGRNTLAVTMYRMQGNTLIEMDVFFNKAVVWDSYRGPLKFPIGGGMAIADIQRVFLHEVGHGIGLGHFEGTKAVMNAMISDLDVLANDDVAGVQALYGAPAPTPPPPTPPPATPTPTPAPTATPPPPGPGGQLANISTRMKVGVDEDVLIGGFMIVGSEPKRLILRAMGPSLAAGGVAGAMEDPILELYDGSGTPVRDNDDWQDSDQAGEIAETGVAPASHRESAMVVTLQPGSYTAVVRGWENTEGIGLVEAYVLDSGSAQLVNLSTRGRIGVGEEALIGGLIVTGTAGKHVIIRALGPSLGSVGGTLADPMIEVRDGAGNLVGENNNWADGAQRDAIIATGVPPGNALESAIVATLTPGNYTAVVRGVNDGSGVGLVEIFDLTK